MSECVTTDCKAARAIVILGVVLLGTAAWHKLAHADEIEFLLGSEHLGATAESLYAKSMRNWRAKGLTPETIKAPDVCEFNPGLAYHWDNGWHAGAYRNTDCNVSGIGGYSWRLGDGFSVSLSLATGYDEAPVLPMAAVHYTWGYVRASAAPYRVMTDNLYLDYRGGQEIDHQTGWGVVAAGSVVVPVREIRSLLTGGE